jgi:RNA ligase
MKLYDYLKLTPEGLQELIDGGLIDTSHHDTFPLVMFTYGRKAVSDNTWPEAVRKCRGLIVREDTEEIIARPFEKFFNYGDPLAGELPLQYGNPLVGDMPTLREPDYILEKADGFLCTLYEWEGKQYIASKGSFDSPHARWATAQLQKHGRLNVPTGCTAVFEGITSALRIVVDYKDIEELVLLALIDNETGQELSHDALLIFAKAYGFRIPIWFKLMDSKTAIAHTLDPDIKNVEGYVLVWRREGQTPFRLKLKYTDYLRIHRMVCGVSPKRVFEALALGWDSELNTWLDESTPWFNHFVSKWKGALETRFKDIALDADNVFTTVRRRLQVPPFGVAFPTRKDWALEFMKTPDIAPVLFGMLDGKDVNSIIWKKVKPMISGGRPMVDAART